MAAVVDTDWSIAANGDIRYTGSTTNNTVIEFHRWLQDKADDAVASGDDILDITDTTPSDRSTDNIITLNSPYNIDDTAAEHLFDGSITQDGGDVVYSGLVVVGSVPAGTNLQIVQNNLLLTSYWGTGLNADATANILLRIMVKTRTGGADTDGKRLRVQARELGDTYSEFSLTAGLGNATAAIFTGSDLNNQTVAGTISGWTSITNTEGLRLLDVNGNGSNEEYYSEWDLGVQSINDLYERTKWIQRRATSETLYGMNGELFRGITHSFAYDNESGGPFTQNEVLTFGNGATGALLALDDDGTTGNMYIQLLTGVAPSDNDTITGGTSSATADINGSVTARTISSAFVGVSTGSALIGAYGVGVETSDLTNSDLLFDLTNTPQTPPNNVTFTVSGVVSGEDRILVGPENGAGGLDEDQLSLNTTLNGAAETSVVVTTTIPSDTPASGTLRVVNDSGYHVLLTYSSYTGSTFTVTSADFSGSDENDSATSGNDCYITYIDKLAAASSENFTSVYSSSRTLFVRVRDGGGTPIKTFETTGTLGSGGGSATAIRTSDA